MPGNRSYTPTGEPLPGDDVQPVIRHLAQHIVDLAYLVDDAFLRLQVLVDAADACPEPSRRVEPDAGGAGSLTLRSYTERGNEGNHRKATETGRVGNPAYGLSPTSVMFAHQEVTRQSVFPEPLAPDLDTGRQTTAPLH